MPFRHANQYGGFDYPMFPTDGNIDFTTYDDSLTDPSKSPYDDFTLDSPTEVACQSFDICPARWSP